MRILIDYARADGLERLEGMVLRGEPRHARRWSRGLGFELRALDPDDPAVVVSRLEL